MQGKKRAIILSGIVLAMSMALMLGLTFAWFTDSVRNEGNVIKAGEMQVEWLYRSLDGEEKYSAVPEGNNNPLFKGDSVWEIGEKQGYDFQVVNTGNLAAEWKLTFENVTSSGKADLTEVLDVYVDGEPVGTMQELSAEGKYIVSGTLEKGAKREFSVAIGMNEDAGNEYQGGTVKFGVGLYAKQTNENADYDDEYAPPAFEEAQEIINEAKPGDKVKLPEGAEISETLVVDKELTIDANGAVFAGSENASTVEVKAEGVKIENATIRSANKNFGILVRQGASDVTISGCTFEGKASEMGHAIWTDDANGIIIENCSFQRPINLANAQNVTVRNNEFSLGFDVNGITLSGTVNGVTIENNTLVKSGSSLIRLEQGLKDTSTGIVVKGNDVGSGKLIRNSSSDISKEQLWNMIDSGAIVTDTFELSTADDFARAEAAQADGQTWIVKGYSSVKLENPINVTKSIAITATSNRTISFEKSAGIVIGADLESFTLKNITLKGVNATGQEAMNEPYMGLGTYNLGYGIGKLTVENCAIDGFDYGMYFGCKAENPKTVKMNMAESTVKNCLIKGMYFETLTDSSVNGCTFTDNGNDAEKVGENFAAWISGVDINLKYGDYGNIAFEGCTFTGNGANNGAALLLKARDDGSYASKPATLDKVTVNGCTFEGNHQDIVLGEKDKENATPANVTIENCGEAKVADYRKQK